MCLDSEAYGLKKHGLTRFECSGNVPCIVSYYSLDIIHPQQGPIQTREPQVSAEYCDCLRRQDR